MDRSIGKYSLLFSSSRDWICFFFTMGIFRRRLAIREEPATKNTFFVRMLWASRPSSSRSATFPVSRISPSSTMPWGTGKLKHWSIRCFFPFSSISATRSLAESISMPINLPIDHSSIIYDTYPYHSHTVESLSTVYAQLQKYTFRHFFRKT